MKLGAGRTMERYALKFHVIDPAVPSPSRVFLIAVGLALISALIDPLYYVYTDFPPKTTTVVLQIASFAFVVLSAVRLARRNRWAFDIKRPLWTALSLAGTAAVAFWMMLAVWIVVFPAAAALCFFAER